MTAGYGSGGGMPGQHGDDAAGQPPDQPSTTDRPGPLPPRLAPPAGHAPIPGQPGAGYPGSATPPGPGSAAGHPAAPAAGHPVPPAPRAGWSPTPPGDQWGGPASAPTAQTGWPPATPGATNQPTSGSAYPASSTAGSHPAAPTSGSYPAAPTSGSYPASSTSGSGYPAAPTPGSAYPAAPSSASYPAAPTSGSAYPASSTSGPAYPGQPAPGAAYPGQAASGPAYPGQAGAGPAYPGAPGGPGPTGAQPGADPVYPGQRPSRRWLPVVALALAGVLAVVAGVQAYQIHRLGDRLTATDRRLAEAQGADGQRFDGLEGRADALEKQAGATFNPEAVASAVLPSVFRVRAGQFTGTAFAIGKAPAGGGTTLLTNFHVVEAVYNSGGRKVFLERTDQRFDATIVKVDKDKDIAQLRSTARFKALVAGATPVKSGQQIVVVGAPLGLQDSVTTGVVSAFRKDEGGSGPVIQFDAPINPGNSGGPVINGAKEVVGIATAKARDAEGIGLAVPIKTACDTFTLC
ncbi:trypsin-like peptidase domain-containing protein [Micromonospora sp. HK10]|uniref:trypsin-like peptidase domain-containing protein n=1 Tax=Micromonospora sp. HK10 TaxID=1538294 RepID=UPI000627077A|nr:trypsin-like peptidase domain-containing protein [Micromonospora sp. HK10]KKK07381.1 peptidase S1 [Micromonospora sp. HK10]